MAAKWRMPKGLGNALRRWQYRELEAFPHVEHAFNVVP